MREPSPEWKRDDDGAGRLDVEVRKGLPILTVRTWPPWSGRACWSWSCPWADGAQDADSERDALLSAEDALLAITALITKTVTP